jgi:UPF0271 protein
MKIDINCDMGESIGSNIIGNDAAIFPYITSCNIACGFHGGDPYHIQKTIDKALEHGVRIGAHPSYQDLEGFGRRKMEIERSKLKSILQYQVSAVKGMVESAGGRLSYVKPHGALYNTAAMSVDETQTIIEGVSEIDNNIALMGLANSVMMSEAEKSEISFIAEAFADRRYNSNGQLKSRNEGDSVIHNPDEALQQVVSLWLENKINTDDGNQLNIKADSICVHGDNPQAVEILKAINTFISSQS